MKHHLKNIRPPVTPRLAIPVTLTILVSCLTALTILTSDLASTSIPEALKPYARSSWPVLCVLLLLGIIAAVGQVWYARSQSANNGTSPAPTSQRLVQMAGTASPSAPTAQPGRQTVAATSSLHQDGQTAGTTTRAPSTQHAPVSGTAPAPSVAPSAIPTTAHYHTCVIGYSDKDALFVKKLYNDLKALGVPCLLVEQDLKIGDKLRLEIYRAIRQLDKLLLVLSQDTIESKWVEEAVDVALDREHQQPGTYLLFPLRLDNAVLNTEKYWAIAVRQRLIGDFRHWQQDTEYQQAFQRVLRDLRV